jgi:hypothetical protein
MLVAVWRSRHGGDRHGRHRAGAKIRPDDEIEAGIA